ncbi:MAG: J domain-containing protein, partial [Planctomycetes bacterium]|nr:J domain-containing protein [Planctomycetota bacterium]
QQRLNVKIPAGIEDSQTLRLVGQGEVGRAGGAQGDLLIEVDIQPHPTLNRDGKAIRNDVHVPLATALLGGKVDVATIHGTVVMAIPAGTSCDQVLRLRGQGIKTGDSHGDHLARVVVDIPKDLSEAAQEAVRTHLS